MYVVRRFKEKLSARCALCRSAKKQQMLLLEKGVRLVFYRVFGLFSTRGPKE
jgi:hypothetical protein